MELESKLISINNCVIRFHQPMVKGPSPLVLLLHGWTGDENSMWIFTSRLPRNAMLISPRGLFKTRAGGYSWHPEISEPWPSLNDFLPAVERLFSILSSEKFPAGNFSELHILGFSQGAALAYCFAAIHPERVAMVAGLSGFLPGDASEWLTPGRWHGLPMFVAHGSEDELVPVALARKSVDMLEKAGAIVAYCEDNVGHKLSAKCFRGLEAFYEKANC